MNLNVTKLINKRATTPKTPTLRVVKTDLSHEHQPKKNSNPISQDNTKPREANLSQTKRTSVAYPEKDNDP
jgi:hypothetical protein